jgi:hypothetical protein
MWRTKAGFFIDFVFHVVWLDPHHGCIPPLAR